MAGWLKMVAVIFGLTILCDSVFYAQLKKPASNQRQKRQAIDKEGLTAQAVEAFKRNDRENARLLFEKALTVDSANVTAHTYLGIIDDAAGDLKNAEIHFAKSARLSPDSASARNNYGAILLRLRRFKEATTEFEASLRLDPQQPNALVNLAQIRFDENTPDGLRKAQSFFEKADALTPDAAIARSLVIIALRLKNPQKASEFYQIYAARLAKREGAMPDAAARLELGGALLEAKLLDSAETELKAVLESDNANSEAMLRLGQIYLARNDINSAGRVLETAVARNAATARIYSLLAVVYEKSNHYENAIPAMRLAIQLEPESENYRYQYGIILTNAYAPAAAVIRLNEALKMFPKSPRLWLALGLANLKADKNAQAERAINRAVELDPKFAQAYVYLGLARDQSGQYGEAVKLYEQALSYDSSLAVVHQMIADALLKQTNSSNLRIESELKKSIFLDATFVPAYLTLGKLYVRMQRWADAAGQFEKAAALDSNLVEAYYHLARVYTRLNRKTEAQAILAKFKDLNETQKTKSEKEIRELVSRLADVRF